MSASARAVPVPVSSGRAGRSEEYRPDIDGLRAISILAVVLYHARVPGFGAGYLGVDIFFVISGFLITGQLLREAKSTGTIQMAMFYARRVRRLIPAFVAMAVGTTVLALIYLLPMTEQKLFGNALTQSALFYYNIAIWRGGYAYDGEPAEQQVLMHTWSLGVEEQFYLVWPVICLVALRLGRPLNDGVHLSHPWPRGDLAAHRPSRVRSLRIAP